MIAVQIRRRVFALAVMLSLPALNVEGREPDAAREAHGVFTGEIKPVLYVSDVEVSAPFYRDVLGFDFQGYANSKGEPYYAEMVAAGVKFGLHEPTSPAQASKVGQQRLYFRVRDLAAHRARVLAWGAQAGDIKETSWMDMFTVTDPDGNEIVFAVTDPTRQTSNPWELSASAEVDTIASGGWRIVGDLVVPVATRPVPAVILLNKAAGDRTAYAELADRLAAYGIASLRIDLRGHGESTNLGRFVPAEGTDILKGSDDDVVAATDRLAHDPRVDPARIGYVGASYSGEVMMQAARRTRYGAAYVGLSPGSLSDESIDAIDSEELPWLLVVSRHERHLTEVAEALRERSRSAEFLELSGDEHATRLFGAHPDLAERIAVWFQHRLISMQ